MSEASKPTSMSEEQIAQYFQVPYWIISGRPRPKWRERPLWRLRVLWWRWTVR